MTWAETQNQIVDLQRQAKRQLEELQDTLDKLDEVRARRRPVEPKGPPRLRVIAGGRS